MSNQRRRRQPDTTNQPKRRRQPNQRQRSDAERTEREEKIWQLRLQGMSLRKIALAVDRSHVYVKDVLDRGYAERIYPKVDEARLLEVERLDELQHRAWKVLDAHHVTVSNGKIVYLGGTPLNDDAPVLQAIDRLLRIAERRAKLLGLDAPTKVQTDGQVKYVIEGIDMEALK